MKKLLFALYPLSIIVSPTTNHLAAAESTTPDAQKEELRAQLRKLTRDPNNPQQPIQEKAYAKFAKDLLGGKYTYLLSMVLV